MVTLIEPVLGALCGFSIPRLQLVECAEFDSDGVSAQSLVGAQTPEAGVQCLIVR
jgi:hypothetical protein